MTVVELRRLGAETFGQRLRRARESAGVTLKDVADFITRQWQYVSMSTIARLETLAEPPGDAKRRALACAAVLGYGFEPAQFGLSTDDLPRLIKVESLLASGTTWRASPGSWCTELARLAS